LGIAGLFLIIFVIAIIASISTSNSYAEESIKTSVIKTKFGDIVIKLLSGYAPNTVKNFVELSESGFYDGVLFHRIIPDFVIQGGDPNTISGTPDTWGQGGPGYSIDAEFSELKHSRGVVSMARSTDPNSAGSQFFIVHKDSNFLDGQYTIFGYVIDGLEVVDKIASLETTTQDQPIDVESARILTIEITDMQQMETPEVIPEIKLVVSKNPKQQFSQVNEPVFVKGQQIVVSVTVDDADIENQNVSYLIRDPDGIEIVSKIELLEISNVGQYENPFAPFGFELTKEIVISTETFPDVDGTYTLVVTYQGLIKEKKIDYVYYSAILEREKIDFEISQIKRGFANTPLPLFEEFSKYFGEEKAKKYEKTAAGQERDLNIILEYIDVSTEYQFVIIDSKLEELENKIKNLDISMDEKTDLIIELRRDANEYKYYIQQEAKKNTEFYISAFEMAEERQILQMDEEKEREEIVAEILEESPNPETKGDLVNDVVIDEGGCLIATATYGSELAPQVQQLREIRDNSLLQTKSGSMFMESFNSFYYSFSPEIADLERENPMFKETVKLVITPLLTSLLILNYVDMDSEIEVLGYGISLILLNVGMYFVAPTLIIFRVFQKIHC